jgi:hypothetical protein
MRFSHCKRRRNRGASLIEFVIVVPVFAFLIAGIFEMALMYRTKALLNAATFQAALQGSVNNALLNAMNSGLADGMMPMFLNRTSRNLGGAIAAKGLARARIAMRGGGITIVSPSRDAFRMFAERQRVNGAMRQVIPNDNLMWRPADNRNVQVSGQSVSMNVQDANLLKIKSYWCYKLLTPVLDQVIYRAAVGLVPRNENRNCAAMNVVSGGYHIALTSSAIVRMQSPVYQDNLP